MNNQNMGGAFSCTDNDATRAIADAISAHIDRYFKDHDIDTRSVAKAALVGNVVKQILKAEVTEDVAQKYIEDNFMPKGGDILFIETVISDRQCTKINSLCEGIHEQYGYKVNSLFHAVIAILKVVFEYDKINQNALVNIVHQKSQCRHTGKGNFLHDVYTILDTLVRSDFIKVTTFESTDGGEDIVYYHNILTPKAGYKEQDIKNALSLKTLYLPSLVKLNDYTPSNIAVYPNGNTVNGITNSYEKNSNGNFDLLNLLGNVACSLNDICRAISGVLDNIYCYKRLNIEKLLSVLISAEVVTFNYLHENDTRGKLIYSDRALKLIKQSEFTPEEIESYYQELTDNSLAEIKAGRCNSQETINRVVSTKLRNSIIDLFSHYNEFYFPYFQDTRGRVYAKSNCGLNPQGHSLERGQICFAKGEKGSEADIQEGIEEFGLTADALNNMNALADYFHKK